MSIPLIPGVPGDKLVAPLNAPAAGNATSGVQPGVSSGIVLAQYVVVFGSTGGVFVYSGTPAHGNPPLYWMGNVTADPYGNAVNPGIWAGQASGPQVGMQVNAGSGELLFPFPGTFTSNARIGAIAVGSGAVLEAVSPQDMAPSNDLVRLVLEDNAAASGSATWLLVYNDATGGSNTHMVGSFSGVTIYVAQLITAVAPGTGTSVTNPATPETWHTMSLLNSWAAPGGFVANKYRLVASPANSVEIIGSLSGTAATAGTFATLPSAYHPASQQRFAAEGAASSAGAPGVQCDTSGNLTMAGIPGLPVADSWFYHGFISLDA